MNLCMKYFTRTDKKIFSYLFLSGCVHVTWYLNLNFVGFFCKRERSDEEW